MISFIIPLALAAAQDTPGTQDVAPAPSTEEAVTAPPEPQRDPVTGELPVDPYQMSNANAAATPFGGNAMRDAFHGQDGIRRIVNDMVDRSVADPRISKIFVAHDLVRLRRTLFEQFCYILNAGCTYSGRDMVSSHKDLGLQVDDLNALVEHLQAAMATERVGFAAQNRFLSKLAPMKPDVVTR